MKHYYANGIFNGTVLVSENGKVIYRKAFGYSNNETKQKLIPGSSFDLASVSKQFTAMGIMILKEKNKLSYDDKLIKYFPEFPAYSYILLTNIGDAILLKDINVGIENILSSSPYELAKIPVFSKLKESLKNNSSDIAIKITKKAIKETPNEFAFDDDAINELGYKYLNDKKINDAFLCLNSILN